MAFIAIQLEAMEQMVMVLLEVALQEVDPTLRTPPLQDQIAGVQMETQVLPQVHQLQIVKPEENEDLRSLVPS